MKLSFGGSIFKMTRSKGAGPFTTEHLIERSETRVYESFRTKLLFPVKSVQDA